MSVTPGYRGVRKAKPTRASSDAAMLVQAPSDIALTMRRDIDIVHALRADLYHMTTVPSVRMELQRREICRQGIEDDRVPQTLFRWALPRETWRTFFERVHGEPL